MNSTKPVPDQPTYEVAGFKDRAIARAVDGFVTVCILLVMWFAAGWVLFDLFFVNNVYVPAQLLLLLWVAVLAAVMRYEVHLTARRWYTIGKKIAEISVIRWSAFNDAATCQPFPSYGQSLIRWLVPHVVLFAGLVVSVLLWGLADGGSYDLNPLVWFIGPVGWVLLYLTSLLDKNGRGWHDKAAGTVVVKAPRTDPS